MYLEINGNAVNEPVSGELIEKMVYSLTGEGDSFLILSVDEMTYIQASGDPSGGFTLEYQDGSLEQHYYCADPDISADKVIDAFSSYLDRNDDWRKRYLWKREHQGTNTGQGIARYLVVFIIVAMLTFIAWRYSNSA